MDIYTNEKVSCDARTPLSDAFQLIFHQSNPSYSPVHSEELTIQFEETNKIIVWLHLISQ